MKSIGLRIAPWLGVRGHVVLLAALVIGVAPPAAVAWMVDWDGTTYPEESPEWERIAYGGGAVRTLADGTMNLDG